MGRRGLHIEAIAEMVYQWKDSLTETILLPHGIEFGIFKISFSTKLIAIAR